jgi:hypothetical protein
MWFARWGESPHAEYRSYNARDGAKPTLQLTLFIQWLCSFENILVCRPEVCKNLGVTRFR